MLHLPVVAIQQRVGWHAFRQCSRNCVCISGLCCRVQLRDCAHCGLQSGLQNNGEECVGGAERRRQRRRSPAHVCAARPDTDRLPNDRAPLTDAWNSVGTGVARVVPRQFRQPA